MSDPVANFAFGYLASGILSTDTSLTFRTGDGANFPSTAGGAYNCPIYDALYPNAAVAYQTIIGGKRQCEIVRFQTLVGDNVTSMLRAQEGTTALDFNNPLKVYRVERSLTALDWTGLSSVTYVDVPIVCVIGGSFGAQTTNYCGFGGVSLSAAESSVQYSPFGVTGTVVGMYYQAKSDTHNNSFTITLQSGAADAASLTASNVSLTIGAGIKNGSDTAHTLSVTPTMIGGFKFVSTTGTGASGLMAITLIVRCTLH